MGQRSRSRSALVRGSVAAANRRARSYCATASRWAPRVTAAGGRWRIAPAPARRRRRPRRGRPVARRRGNRSSSNASSTRRGSMRAGGPIGAVHGQPGDLVPEAQTCPRRSSPGRSQAARRLRQRTSHWRWRGGQVRPAPRSAQRHPARPGPRRRPWRLRRGPRPALTWAVPGAVPEHLGRRRTDCRRSAGAPPPPPGRCPRSAARPRPRTAGAGTAGGCPLAWSSSPRAIRSGSSTGRPSSR